VQKGTTWKQKLSLVEKMMTLSASQAQSPGIPASSDAPESRWRVSDGASAAHLPN
jgi:hypothetical protein